MRVWPVGSVIVVVGGVVSYENRVIWSPVAGCSICDATLFPAKVCVMGVLPRGSTVEVSSAPAE